jgi:uncharacterized membrane protein
MVNWNQVIHDIFEGAILIKFLDGILQLIGGILLFFVGPTGLNSLLRYLFRSELLEDPQDTLFHLLDTLSRNVSVSSQAFAAFYLLAHGILHIFIAVSLWKRKLWAYPVAGILLSLLVIYQLYQFYFTQSLILLMLTFIDTIIIALLHFEYARAVKSLK